MDSTVSRSLLVAAVALFVGLVVGWSLGSWSACGSGCGFDVSLFAALGTWVGGVAIALASLVISISKVRGERRRRREDAIGRAMVCVLRVQPVVNSKSISRVEFRFENKTPFPVQRVSAHLEGGKSLRADAVVESGRTWGFKAQPEQLGISYEVESEDEARKLVKKDILPNLVFDFTIEGHRFVRRNRQTYVFDSAPAWRLPDASHAGQRY